MVKIVVTELDPLRGQPNRLEEINLSQIPKTGEKVTCSINGIEFVFKVYDVHHLHAAQGSPMAEIYVIRMGIKSELIQQSSRVKLFVMKSRLQEAKDLLTSVDLVAARDEITINDTLTIQGLLAEIKTIVELQHKYLKPIHRKNSIP